MSLPALQGLHVVRCDQVEPARWRNGAGLARDLLHWPNAADWRVRISVADIDVDSPFSVYPDTERWFAVVEGQGVRLRLPAGTRTARSDGPALQFRGEDAPACELIDGPTRDLNLMCRRGLGSAGMRRAEPGLAFDDAGSLHALFSADPVSLLDSSAGEPLPLPPFTLVWSDRGAVRWQIDSAIFRPRAWWLVFDPRSQR